MNILNDYIIIDDFFKDPKEVVKNAKECYYYESKVKESVFVTEMGDLKVCGKDANIPKGFWRGYRTANLKLVQKDFENNFSSLIKETISSKLIVNYDMKSFFQITTKNINHLANEWWHQDECSLSGVVYLAENPPPNSGTLLKDKNNQDVVIENKFNRCILYNGLLFHRIESCFGSSLNDCRLTLVFFIDNLNIKSEYSKP